MRLEFDADNFALWIDPCYGRAQAVPATPAEGSPASDPRITSDAPLPAPREPLHKSAIRVIVD
jgi:hypothetical protein